jgi:hypothetical protein
MVGRPESEKPTTPGGSKADPEQYQRFLDKARELGLDPTAEANLSHIDEVVRRMAKLPSEHTAAKPKRK